MDDLIKLEEKAKALQAKAQELNQQVQRINIEYIKVIGVIEYLKGLKDET
jgi:prefoldin subunit 5